MKKKIVRSFAAGLLLGLTSMYGAAFLALLVWYRHIPWEGKPFIPLYQSIVLLLPLQRWTENLGFPGFVLAVAIKGVVYGSLVFCVTLIRDFLAAKRPRRRMAAK